MSDGSTLGEKLQGLRLAAQFNPSFAAVIVVLNLATAVFEGIGLGLLLPIIEAAQAEGDLATEASGVSGYFLRVYEAVGVPFTLETLLIGLGCVMTLRFSLSFVTSWLQVKLRTQYLSYLREQAFQNLLAADVAYFDEQDGDKITNTIITETARSSGVINLLLSFVQTFFFILVYMLVALLIAPALTLITVVVLGTVAFLTRYVLQSGYEIGSRVVDANERIQGLVNAGIRGMREIKLFNMGPDLTTEYREAHEKLVRTRIKLARNQAAISNFNQLLNALALFVLVYLGISYLELPFASLGVFLFAMFRLSPQISSLNNSVYNLDGSLPHIIRSHDLIDELDANTEPAGGEPAPDPVTSLSLDAVTFRYDSDDEATDVRNISLEAERGETVAFVGPSGAGKSTIISLIARLYDPDEGVVRANGRDLRQIDLRSWHDRVTVVPQHPFVFNETLRYNVTIGNRDATQREIERACEISQVAAFLDELPNGLDSKLGDDAVKLSGGQRQRVAIARALLTDADVLLLDEATSELDSPTEKRIIDGIEAMDQEFLTIIVGHFLSTVQDADRIYTIVDGELVGTGTHRELLASNTHYAELYGSQAESTTD